MKKTSTFYSILFAVITLGCVLVVWSVAAAAVGSQFVLPSISQTATALVALFKDVSFYSAYAMTVLRSVIAFALSFSIAFALAFTVKKFALAEKFISPIISIVRCLPTVAVVLLLMFWTNSQVAPIIVTMMVVLPTLYTNLLSSFECIDNEVVQTCKLFNVDGKQIFFKVKLPAVLPSALLAAGSGLALNVKLMVAAEVLAATANSIGNKLAFSNYNLQVATMIALVVVTVITGMIVEGVFRLISKKVGKWK